MKIKHLIFIFYIACALYFFLLLQSNSPRFIDLTEEGCLVEWATFWGYFLAAVIFFGLFIQRLDQGFLKVWFLLFVAIGCIFVAAEEISWGQHLLHFKTPDIILKHNFQNEFNIHNLGEWGRDWPRRLYMILLFLYLIVFPIMANIIHPISRLADRIGVILPPFDLVIPFSCSLLLPLYIKAQIVLGAELPKYHGYSAEVMEMFSAFLFIHFAFFEYLKGRRMHSN